MAEKKATDKQSEASKRRVKNPETFREKAVKAMEQSDQPSRKSKAKSFGGKAVAPVTRPVKAAATKLGSQKPVRILRKPFHWIGLVLVPIYFRRSWTELKLVEWPNRKQSRQLTFAVLVFAIIFGLLIAGVDYILDKIFKSILLK